jgi:hypothetical protein
MGGMAPGFGGGFPGVPGIGGIAPPGALGSAFPAGGTGSGNGQQSQNQQPFTNNNNVTVNVNQQQTQNQQETQTQQTQQNQTGGPPGQIVPEPAAVVFALLSLPFLMYLGLRRKVALPSSNV